jgi:hypothetical protein
MSFLHDNPLLHYCSLFNVLATTSAYSYKQNAQEIFENFFGTGNPFSAFGFGESAPFSTRLNKPGPKKENPG